MSTLGDIATVAAPTVVAVAAIGTSTWQQSRSRAFDRAERAKDREHERQLSDLDYQRRLVDDVAAALESANEAITPLYFAVSLQIGTSEKEIAEATDAIHQAHERLTVANARMVLRFGSSHQAVGTVDQAAEALRRARTAGITYSFLSEERRARMEEEVEQARRDTSEATAAFLEVTGGIVGSAPERS